MEEKVKCTLCEMLDKFHKLKKVMVELEQAIGEFIIDECKNGRKQEHINIKAPEKCEGCGNNEFALMTEEGKAFGWKCYTCQKIVPLKEGKEV